MKKRVLAFILTAALLLSMIPMVSLSAYAAESEKTSSGATSVFSVTDFGASGSDTADDTQAFQEALNQRNTSQFTVNVPKGTYYISRSLFIFSNTKLVLADDAKIVATFVEGAMIRGAHRNTSGAICKGNACNHGGYDRVVNVSISGGVWDRNDRAGKGDDTVIAFHHAKYITICDTTLKNCTDHFLNLSGVKYGDVTNVTFQDAAEYTGDSSIFWGSYAKGNKERFNALEAIHTDFCSPDSEKSDYATPYDHSPSIQINVTGCTFKNVFSCLGTHHPAKGDRANGLKAENNVASNIRSYFCYGYDADSVKLYDNKITNAGAIGTFYHSTVTLKNNTFTAAANTSVSENAVYAHDATTLKMMNNSISGARLSGVSATGAGTSVYAENNTISSPLFHGFSAQDNATLYADTNTVTAPAGCAFYLKNAKTDGNGITNSTITRCGTHALYQSGGTVRFSDNTINTTAKTALRGDTGAEMELNRNTINSAGEFAINTTGNSTLNASRNTISGSGASKPAIKTADTVASISSNKITGAAYHGIVVTTTKKAAIAGNTISSPKGYGIHVQNATGVMVTSNTVTSSKMNALQVEGESASKTASATIMSNRLTAASASNYDLRLGKYAKGCILSSNVLGNKRLSVDATASYTSYLATPILKSAAAVYGGVKVTCYAVSGASKYRFFRKTATTNWTKVGDTTATSLVDKTAVDGTKYFYTVRCVTADGKKNKSFFDESGISLTYNASVVISKIENLSGGTKLTWKKTKNAAKYRVYTKSSGSWKKLIDMSGTSLIITGLKSGSKHTVTVRPINSSGSFIGGYNTKGWTFQFISPPALKSVKNTSSGIKFIWSRPSGAAKFRVFRKTASSSWSKLGDVAGSKDNFVDKTAKKGVTYFYTVKCISADGKKVTSACNSTGLKITRK